MITEQEAVDRVTQAVLEAVASTEEDLGRELTDEEREDTIASILESLTEEEHDVTDNWEPLHNSNPEGCNQYKDCAGAAAKATSEAAKASNLMAPHFSSTKADKNLKEAMKGEMTSAQHENFAGVHQKMAETHRSHSWPLGSRSAGMQEAAAEAHDKASEAHGQAAAAARGKERLKNNSKQSELKECTDECDDVECVDECMDEVFNSAEGWIEVNSNPEGHNQYTGGLGGEKHKELLTKSKAATSLSKGTGAETKAKEAVRFAKAGKHLDAADSHHDAANIHVKEGNMKAAVAHREIASSHSIAHHYRHGPGNQFNFNAGINQPRCPEMGRYLNTGAGTGKGEPHRAAKTGHATLTEDRSPSALFNSMHGDCGCGGGKTCDCDKGWMPIEAS